MGVVSLEEFRTAAYRRATRENRPVSCVFEITPTCNLRCHFCFVALDPYRGPYLSTAQMRDAIDRLADIGILWLILTGGEIFSRRDFPEIYRHARSRGMLVTLFTNATMVNESHAAMLRELPPHSIEVSIYGATAEQYEGTTGIPGSFARFERGVSLLQGSGAPILMKHPVTSLSAANLDDIIAWCVSRGLRHGFTLNIENRHDGGQQPSLYRLTARRRNELAPKLSSAPKQPARMPIQPMPVQPMPVPGGTAGMPIAECSGGPDDPVHEERLYQCRAGRAGIFIDALGQVSHCIWDREPAFPFLEMKWEEIHAKMLEWVNQPLPADAPCSGCSMRGGCTNCPARARSATGSPYMKDPHHCETTHAAHGVLMGGGRPSNARPLGACAG